jgi:hypothetical protein
MTDYHVRFLTLVDEIERTFPVTRWTVGGIPVWPLARDGLFVDMYWQEQGKPAVGETRRRASSRVAQILSQAATPLTTLWQSRADLRHAVLFPRRADTLFLGDALLLERVDGVWRDRFFDPLIAELHRNGKRTLVMQRGDRRRVPRSDPVFDANTIEKWGQLFAAGSRLWKRLAAAFPDRERVVKFLDSRGVPAHVITPSLLQKKAAALIATSYGFERVLKVVKPSTCIMMTTSGLGHALALACRRRGVLSVEVQRSGMGPLVLDYCWSAVPEGGYPTLPAVFWTWTQDDAVPIQSWTKELKAPWHRSVCGGHPQLAAWLDDRDPRTQAFDAKIEELREKRPAKLEILVALQNHEGYAERWNAVASLIERAPSDWRWWLRRHPYAPDEDKELGRLMSVRRPNVVVDEASSLPLPALLRHADAFLSMRSGASTEAAMFGLRPIFLAPVARELFPQLFERGQADVIDDMAALEERLRSTARTTRVRAHQPDLRDVLGRLEVMAAEYSELCASAAS